MLFLARWARKLSWKETAESFHPNYARRLRLRRVGEARHHLGPLRILR